MIDIHPLHADEIERLATDGELGHGSWWQSWLSRQERGEIAIFVAWEGELPVGRVLLVWKPSDDPIVFHAGCPWIYDLLTRVDHRSHGVGSALVRACEDAARARGEATIGIGVDANNPRAKALYERLGYADPGIGRQIQNSGRLKAADDTQESEQGEWYLTKSLAPSQ